MKKALLMMLLLCAVLAGQVGQDNRLTVALDVRGVVPTGTSAAGAALSGELATAIGKSGKYVVVNRSPEALKAIQQEIKYTQSGATKDAEAMRKKIGKQDTVSFLCVVEVKGDEKGGYHVRAVLTHVATGRESESANAVSRFKDVFEAKEVAEQLAEDLTGVDLKTRRTAAVQPVQPPPPPVQEVKPAPPPVQEARPVQPPPPPPSNTFTDSRDGQVYRKVNVGGKTWMAQNLNYAAGGSKCYKDNAENCEKYGRLYDWNTAMKACPAGWHLATDAEWTALENAVGGSKTAGTMLKSKTGWKDNGNGTDNYGFSALPGGYGNSGGSFYNAGYLGGWWSATEYDAINARIRNMDYNLKIVRWNYDGKAYWFSVRCIQN
jgi:uncharacterized protein (TIGR02145 family)